MTFRRPFLAFLSGLGMVVGSFMTIRHYFEANFPASIYEGSFCDISAFFNCDSSAYSVISAVADVPIGTFGLMLGLMVMLAAALPGDALARTTRFGVYVNVLGVLALLAYSVFVLGSLCLLCAIYYLFSFVAVWTVQAKRARRAALPDARVLTAAVLITALTALGMQEYHRARASARAGGDAGRVALQFRALPVDSLPSVLSPNWLVRATDRFEDAPLQIVAWEDFLCSDCRYLYEQLKRIGPEFEGQMNVVFQHFPLEAACNDVVDKDKHPGACELSALALARPDRFGALYDAVFSDQNRAEDESGRAEMLAELGLSTADIDSTAWIQLDRLIATGREYEKTSDEYAHGIRSTPTMLINGRLVIGTFPDDLMRAMLHEALAEASPDSTRFLEQWQP